MHYTVKMETIENRIWNPCCEDMKYWIGNKTVVFHGDAWVIDISYEAGLPRNAMPIMFCPSCGEKIEYGTEGGKEDA